MSTIYEITVTHTIDSAHRVLGHQNPDGTPGKCARLHGHTYRFDISLAGPVLGGPGFVVDFGEVKRILDRWDHRTLLADDDPLFLDEYLPSGIYPQSDVDHSDENVLGVVRLPFNPTAENMARHLAEAFVALDGVELARVSVAETPKTTAVWTETLPMPGGMTVAALREAQGL